MITFSSDTTWVTLRLLKCKYIDKTKLKSICFRPNSNQLFLKSHCGVGSGGVGPQNRLVANKLWGYPSRMQATAWFYDQITPETTPQQDSDEKKDECFHEMLVWLTFPWFGPNKRPVANEPWGYPSRTQATATCFLQNEPNDSHSKVLGLAALEAFPKCCCGYSSARFGPKRKPQIGSAP